MQDVSQEDIYREIKRQSNEIAHRIQVLRGGRQLKSLQDKIVILTDDGIAMGSTMLAAISMIKKQHPKKIIIAVPTTSPRIVAYLQNLVDEVIALYTPSPFYAVADAYKRWYDVDDEEVLQILKRLHLK